MRFRWCTTAASATVTTFVASALPPRVAVTTGVNEVPVNVTVALLETTFAISLGLPNTDAETPPGNRASLTAVATALTPAIPCTLTLVWLESERMLLVSNSITICLPLTETASKSPSAGIERNSIVLPRITGSGTTETTWAPSSTRKSKLVGEAVSTVVGSPGMAGSEESPLPITIR